MKVKGRDGTIREEADDYVLRDGESCTIPLSMMDSARPTMIHDGRGNPAGCRPGYLYADSDVAHAVRETVYRQYRDDIEQRWRSDRWQSGPHRSAPLAPTSATADAASVAAAYDQYAHDISERWKHRR